MGTSRLPVQGDGKGFANVHVRAGPPEDETWIPSLRHKGHDWFDSNHLQAVVIGDLHSGHLRIPGCVGHIGPIRARPVAEDLNGILTRGRMVYQVVIRRGDGQFDRGLTRREQGRLHLHPAGGAEQDLQGQLLPGKTGPCQGEDGCIALNDGLLFGDHSDHGRVIVQDGAHGAGRGAAGNGGQMPTPRRRIRQ